MTQQQFDVIVVGAGPAGSAAAHTLARNGATVCIIDKQVFPRDKLCGGLLSRRSRKIFAEIFDTSWEPVVEDVSRDIDFYFRNQHLNSARDCEELTFTRRCRFDAFLLNLAEQAGATLRLGTGVKTVDIGKNTVALRNGPTIKSTYIIGADGVNSVVAKSLYGRAFHPDRIAFCLETEIPRDLLENVSTPEIYFGLARWGYGWVFPKRDTLTVGIGGLHRKNRDLKTQFTRFLKERFDTLPDLKIKGHHIPFGDYRSPPGRDSVLLCGDAAGLVDPITGEGIAFAMQSGHRAGLAITRALAEGPCRSDALGLYNADFKRITRPLDHAKLLRFLLFPSAMESRFVKVFPKSKTLPDTFMSLLADEISYAHFERFLLGKIGKHLIHSIVSPLS